MRLIADSLAMRILEYINKTGDVARKDLYTPFAEPGSHYTYYSRVVKKLIDEGYLEVYKKDKRNYVKLTNKGTRELSNKYDELFNDKNKAKREKVVYRKDTAKRTELVADIKGICTGAGIIVDEPDKPNLTLLFTYSGNHVDINASDLFEDIVENEGVFYSLTEIRKAIGIVQGKNETLTFTRLVGIIMRNGSIKFVYSIKKNLIKWLSENEKRVILTILSFLRESTVISDLIDLTSVPEAIICGSTYSMVPKLIYARKAGQLIDSEDEKEINKEKFRSKNSEEQINAGNLSKVFNVAYYVIASRQGGQQMDLISKLNGSNKPPVITAGFNSMGNLTQIPSSVGRQALTSKGERVFYMPWIDIIELRQYKNQNKPGHVVTLFGSQESISRTLGNLVLSIRDLDGNRLEYHKYDNNGTPLDPELKAKYERWAYRRGKKKEASDD